MEKTKILFINYSLNMGGAETLILALCKGLDPEKYLPAVCCLETGGVLQSEFEKAGIPVYVIEKKDGIDWRLFFKFMKLFKKLKIDIVNTHGSANWLFAGTAAKLCGIPLVHTEHTKPYFNLDRWMKIERVMSYFTEQIVAVADNVAGFMAKKGKISRKKIKTIYNGIDAGVYDINIDIEKKKKDLDLKSSDIVIGNVARLFPNKDHKTLIKAFSGVLKKIPDARLVIAGDGPLKGELLKFAEELGLSGKVMFLGNRRDIPELLRVFDVFALSSILEGLPIVLLEAMASGLPVVATDVDGNPELVMNDETGFVVPAGNCGLFTKALLKLAGDENNAVIMGNAGRERVKEHFSFRKMAGEYEDVFDDVLVRKPLIMNIIKKALKNVVGAVFPGKIVFRGKSTPGNGIALTFDDGPHKENTEKILRTLKEENVKATFFLTGKEIKGFPQGAKMIAEEGHEVGSHSFYHNHHVELEEIRDTEKIIKEHTGVSTDIFRPPYKMPGVISSLKILLNRTKIVMWSIDSDDTAKRSAEELKESFRNKQIESGDIILFHEDYPHTERALRDIIIDLKNRGFNFVTVSEMMQK